MVASWSERVGARAGIEVADLAAQGMSPPYTIHCPRTQHRPRGAAAAWPIVSNAM
jgi:hypothetical protein